jgi:hypothetical protein
MRAWFLGVLKKAGNLLPGLIVLAILAPIAIWFDSAWGGVLESVFGRHDGALWGIFSLVLRIVVVTTALLSLMLLLTGGVNWPWIVRRRRHAAENFYLPAMVPLFGADKPILFQPRHVLFTAQPWAALGLDRDGKMLRLMSLDGRGDVTIDLALMQRAVYVRARRDRKGFLGWLLRPFQRRPAALRLFLHARDYAEPVAYTLLVAAADKTALRRFQALLQAARHEGWRLGMPSSEEWAAVLPRYSGAALIDSGGYWPPKPARRPAAQTA